MEISLLSLFLFVSVVVVCLFFCLFYLTTKKLIPEHIFGFLTKEQKYFLCFLLMCHFPGRHDVK